MSGKRRPKGDGMIRKRYDGRWEARIVIGHKADGSAIFRYAYGKTQRELLSKLNHLKEYYANMDMTEESLITLGEWLIKWLDEYKVPMLRPATIKSYRRAITNHIIPHLGNKMISQVTTQDIQKMYNKIKVSGRVEKSQKHGTELSNGSVRAVHMLLHEAMDGAVKEGLIPVNPTEGTTIPKLGRKDKPVLMEAQIEKFLAQIEGDVIWYDFFYTDLMTGLRRGELCGLKWIDFDAKSGKLHVRRSVRYEKREPVIGETKTNEGNRVITLPKSVVKLLTERKKKAHSEWIFPNPFNIEKPFNPSVAYAKLKKILREADLPDMRFHDLRHTFATHAATSGVDPKTLAGILGHTKASFTLDTYTHVTTDMQKNASSIVGNYITDIFGKELKPWQSEEKTDKEQ